MLGSLTIDGRIVYNQVDTHTGYREVVDLAHVQEAGAEETVTKETRTSAQELNPQHANSQGTDKEDLLLRLRRVEGQVRGIQRMVEEDKYCVDILVQIAAVRSALDRAGLILLENHTRGCVARAIKENAGDEAITELTDVIRRFVK